MRIELMHLVVICLLLAENTLSQDLPILGVIEKTETTIRAVHVASLNSLKRCFIFAFEEKGVLEIFDLNRNLVLKEPSGQGYVYWQEGFLHHNKLYCFIPECTAIDFAASAPTSRRISSTKMDPKKYKEFLGFEEGGRKIVLADYRAGIDLYSLPDMLLIAQIVREEEERWRDDRLGLSGNMVFYSNKTTNLRGMTS